MLKQQRGDTLIEVLFAVTVFSFIVVSSIAIMNQGTAAAQRSLEITTVRQQIDGQAETLRFLHDSYVNAYKAGATFTTSSPAGEYKKIIDLLDNSPASPFGASPTCVVPYNPARNFVLDPVSATVKTSIFSQAPFYAQLVYTGGVLTQSQGIWIEGVRSSAVGAAGYIDFHIRACWNTEGTKIPMNLGTIVRLYEPRG